MVRVELKSLTRVFKDGTRIGPIDLTVEDGEFLTLLGPSGSGKTTTLRLVAGFIEPDEGCLLFNGANIVNIPPNERQIGMVFQSIALFPHMTVYQNIAFGPEMAGWTREETINRVEELADLLGIKHLLFRRVNEISGGEGQRVALARALALKPKLLLLDEPLSALDQQLRERLQGEIRKAQRKLKITTIYVTHSQDEAFAISDRVAILNNGIVEQIGTPKELYSSPKNEFVAKFLGGNVFEGVVESSELDSSIVRVNGYTFNIQKPLQVDSSILFAVRPEDIHIHADNTESYPLAELLTITPQIGMAKISLDFNGQIIVVAVSDLSLVEQLKPLVGNHIAFSFDQESVYLLDR